jgi:hypothetical protein
MRHHQVEPDRVGMLRQSSLDAGSAVFGNDGLVTPRVEGDAEGNPPRSTHHRSRTPETYALPLLLRPSSARGVAFGKSIGSAAAVPALTTTSLS